MARAMIELSGNSPGTWKYRLFQDSRYFNAIKGRPSPVRLQYLRLAILLQPQFVASHLPRGAAYILLRRMEGAVKDLSWTIPFEPEPAYAHYNKAVAYTVMGKDTTSQQDIERTTEIGIDHGKSKYSIEEAEKLRRYCHILQNKA